MAIYGLDKVNIIKLPSLKKTRKKLRARNELKGKSVKVGEIEMSRADYQATQDSISLESFEVEERRMSYRMV